MGNVWGAITVTKTFISTIIHFVVLCVTTKITQQNRDKTITTKIKRARLLRHFYTKMTQKTTPFIYCLELLKFVIIVKVKINVLSMSICQSRLFAIRLVSLQAPPSRPDTVVFVCFCFVL